MTTIINLDSPLYPEKVRGHLKTPKVLYAKGKNLALLNSNSVAIVGTRFATNSALEKAFRLGKMFAEAGYTVVSGLAEGIDTAAHLGALAAGEGKTIAVFGTPLSRVYPLENAKLAKRIVEEGGLLLSAYKIDTGDKERFVERDWLQTALSDVVIPVQAGRNSGTLHTCRAAIDLERTLLVALPDAEEGVQYARKYAGIYHLLQTYPQAQAFWGNEMALLNQEGGKR